MTGGDEGDGSSGDGRAVGVGQDGGEGLGITGLAAGGGRRQRLAGMLNYYYRAAA